MAQHKYLQGNHKLESWTFADAAARAAGTGMGGVSALDVARIAYQQSDGTYWRLTNHSPLAWAQIAGGAGGGAADGKTHVGVGAPSPALGNDGDTYIDKTGLVLYGEKVAGSWGSGVPFGGVQGPPGAGGDPIYYRAADAYTPSDGVERGAGLTNLLRTNGHVALPVATTNPWQQFAGPDYRVGLIEGGVKIPTFASLVGRNSWIQANATGSTEFEMVTLEWKFDQDLPGAQSLSRLYIEGVNVNGRRELGNTRVIGWNLLVRDYLARQDYDLGHSAAHTSQLSAVGCWWGFNLMAGQYAFHEDWRAMNCDVGFVVQGTDYGGGNVDQPEFRHWDTWSCGVGLAMICHPTYPVSENRIIGFWAKQVGSCAIACFHDPLSTHQYDGARLTIDGGSTEYNKTGKYGENVTTAYTFKRYKVGTGTNATTPVADETYTVDVPSVDVWVQKHFRLRFSQYAFQSDTNKDSSDGTPTFPSDPGRSGIICMLDGPYAVLEIGPYVDFPWQQVYSVRARNEYAWVEFIGPLQSGGGIFENVRIWPSALTMAQKAPTATFETYFAIVMSGWGHMQKVDNGDCPSVLDPAYYTNSYIQAPQLAQGAGIHATTGITAGLQAEPTPYTYGGGNVGFFEFAAGNANATARTQYLMGGAVAVNSGGVWDNNVMRRIGGSDPQGLPRFYWWITNIELYNTHSFPVRILAFLDSEFSDYAQDSHVEGCSPALRTHLVPAAVTLWPKQWMRVTILCNPSGDRRLNFMRLDHTADTVRVLARDLGSFRPTEHHRDFLNRALKFGYWSTR